MLIQNVQETKKNLNKLFALNSSFKKNYSANHLVKEILQSKSKYLKVSKKHQTPFYLFDKEGFDRSIKDFKAAFLPRVPNMYIYYAMKANPHPYLVKEAVVQGLGLDTSSGRELKQALATKARSIVFTGPAKTVAELELAVLNASRVTINIDSLTELKKLKKILEKKKKQIKVGVRIATAYHGTWNKFGIPLVDLKETWREIKAFKYMTPIGIQTHMSFNENADSYKAVIKEIGQYLSSSKEIVGDLEYIDLGGGFLPYDQHGIHPWEDPLGHISQIANGYFGPKQAFGLQHLPQPAVPLATYAKEIGASIKKHLFFYKGKFFFEPGRVLAHKAMHIMLTVEDVKKNMVITDGGTNMIGWERFEYDYFPVVNLTNPSKKEKELTVFGSLCTPSDVWGFYIHATKVTEGDVLFIPNQGAYVFTYAQNFIKEIPPVYSL